MIQLSILAAWMFAGLASAALVHPRNQSRLGFAPIAMILGPMWLAVAAEQQPAPARVEDSPRARPS